MPKYNITNVKPNSKIIINDQALLYGKTIVFSVEEIEKYIPESLIKSGMININMNTNNDYYEKLIQNYIIEIAGNNQDGSNNSNCNIQKYNTSQYIDAFKFVALDSNNNIVLADCNNNDLIDKIIGITMDIGMANSEVSVQNSGIIQNDNWNLIPGSIYYLSNNGNITNKISNDGCIKKVGVADSSTQLIIQLEDDAIAR